MISFFELNENFITYDLVKPSVSLVELKLKI